MGMTEDEMVGWHHQLNGYEFEQLWELVTEKAMETRSSTLAWKIPQVQKLGGLQSMGLQRVGYDSMHATDLLEYAKYSLYTHIYITKTAGVYGTDIQIPFKHTFEKIFLVSSLQVE